MEATAVPSSRAASILGLGSEQRLPSGRHALPQSVVREHQRSRLERAILECVGRSGYEATAVRDVLERAGTSRRVFYTEYRDKGDCFLAAYRRAVDELEAMVRRAARGEPSWPLAVEAALGALLDLIGERPEIGRALILEVHAAGPEALRLRAETMSAYARSLEALRPGSAAGSRTPTLVAEGTIGGLEYALRQHLRSGSPPPLEELVQFVLLAGLGPEAESVRAGGRRADAA